MWLKSLGLLMLISLSIAQEEIEETGNRGARLRLQRPRPIGISDPDGIAEGRPIPLRRIPQGIPVDQLTNQRQNSADLLAAALTSGGGDDLADLRGQSLQGTDALQSLLATAAEGDDVIVEYDDIIEVEPQRPQRPQRPSGGRTRLPPGIPRSSRPRPENEKKGQRIPNRPASENVDTVERYSHTNEDGSFTFGYIGEDGSFREETRGVDCITRGKYGYIDPDGKKREFTYVSGLPCDITDENNEGVIDDDDELQREDPISPNDRFRTSDPIQLADDEIPDSARPRQRQPARPAQNDFASFAPQQEPIQRPAPTRVRDPALNNRRPRPGQQSSGALQTLLNIANDAPGQAALPPTRAPQPAVTRPASPPRTPRPTASRPSAFDFDSAVDDFTLNKPALTFDDEPKPAAPAAGTGPNFSTELVFDPASGTFKTELRQALPGGEEIRTSDNAAPSGAARPTERPATPTPSALPPTARPFTAFSPTTLAPRPTQPASPTAFEPLTFPSPAPTTPRPASPRPTAVASPSTTARPAPTPAAPQTASPTPAGSFFFQPFPTLGSPRPLNAAGSPSPATAAPASPRPASPSPSAPTQARPFTTFSTGNGAFVSFGSPARPAAAPQPNAAQPRPVAAQPRPVAPQPTPARPAQPTPVQQFTPQPFTAQPRPVGQPFGQPFTVFGNPSFRPQPSPVPSASAPEAPRQSASPSPAPRPTPQASPAPTLAPSPRPTPAAAPRPVTPAAVPRPVTPAGAVRPVTPQVQFGFQPIQQSSVPSSQPQARPPPPQQGRPFTAFASGPPPQLNNGAPQFQSRPPTTFFGQPQPQQQRPQQLGIPPQLQGQPQQGRFQPFNRPPPGQPQGRPQQRPSPFTVFNPAALVGARFF